MLIYAPGQAQAQFEARLDEPSTAAAGSDEALQELPPPSLAEIADTADFIGLVQVLDTDYQYQREFPVGGTAFLRVLIPYKVTRPVPDIIGVYEEGLHPNECYFADTPPTEEGRRFVLLARENPEVAGQFLGLEQGCALTVLVTSDNGYALRFPLDGLEVSDQLDDLATAIDFSDPHAVIDYENLDVDQRKTLLNDGYLEERDDRTYKVTHGVSLSDFRGLIGERNLTRDRALLRPITDPFEIEN